MFELLCETGRDCLGQNQNCPLMKLQRIAPGIATHINLMVAEEGLEQVVRAARKQERVHDSFDYGIMVHKAGSHLVEMYDNGGQTEQKALFEIADCHGVH